MCLFLSLLGSDFFFNQRLIELFELSSSFLPSVGPDHILMGFPASSAGKRIRVQCRRPWFNSWVRKIPWRRDGRPSPVFLGFTSGPVSKESICNEGDLGSIPGLGRSLGGRHGNPLQYSCLENLHDRGA